MIVRVKDVMVTNVLTIDGMAPLMEGLNMMLSSSVKSIIIKPRHANDAFGILTFTDIAQEVIADDKQELDLLNVFDVMSKPCMTVQSELDIKYAARLMTRVGVSRMLVVDGNEMLGIVSLTDLVKSLVKEKNEEGD